MAWGNSLPLGLVGARLLRLRLREVVPPRREHLTFCEAHRASESIGFMVQVSAWRGSPMNCKPWEWAGKGEGQPEGGNSWANAIHLNSGPTSAINTRHGLGADTVPAAESPAGVQGKPKGDPTETQGRPKGGPREPQGITTGLTPVHPACHWLAPGGPPRAFPGRASRN